MRVTLRQERDAGNDADSRSAYVTLASRGVTTRVDERSEAAEQRTRCVNGRRSAQRAALALFACA
jgi:hypothetical protein